MKKFKGTGVAIVTPFKNDSSIDFSALGRVINHVIKGGINYIVALGTTGESVTLTKDEKQAIISYVLEAVDSRVPLIVGVGGPSGKSHNFPLKATISHFRGVNSLGQVLN